MLISIHGFTETDVSWQSVLGPLQKPFTCALVPGHGHKPCPPGESIESVAAAMAERYGADEPVDLVGYSLGGRIALRWALDNPESVRRLILVSSRPGIADPEIREKRRCSEGRLAEILDEEGIGPFVAWWEANPRLKPFTPLPRPMVEDIRSRRLNQDAKCLAQGLRQLGQGVMEPLWDRLSELKIPVLLVTGDADEVYKDNMKRMKEAIDNASLEIVPECGHAVHREKQQVLLHLIREFLER